MVGVGSLREAPHDSINAESRNRHWKAGAHYAIFSPKTT